MPEETTDSTIEETTEETTDDTEETTDDETTDDAEETTEDEAINADDFEPEARGGKYEVEKDEDDDDMDADDKARIDKQISRQLTPLQRRIQDQNDTIEVNDYVMNNPEMSKYKPVILKYMKHDAYKNIPVKNIASIVAGGDMKKIGAKLEREASQKVKATKKGGSSSRGKDTNKYDPTTSTFAEHEAEMARVKGQR